VKKSAADLLELRQQKLQQNPRSLSYLVALGFVELQQARNSDAIALSEKALGEISSAPVSAAPFDDQQAEYQTLMALHAYALYQDGRFDEAVTQLQAALDLAASFSHNVAFRLRMAEWQTELDQPEAALAALPDVASLGVEHLQHRAMIQADIALETGDSATWDIAVATLRAHELDSPAWLERALMHKGDLDGAATVLIHRLESPELRLAALMEIQTYREAPLPPRAQSWRARAHQVVERADVRTAIHAVGNVDDYPLVE
jgi:tetratricopeptide (TPR) repeat protein